MTSITVVGGLYIEQCAWPDWNMIFGSGGRGAAAVSGLVDEVRLLSYADDELVRAFAPYAALYDMQFEPTPVSSRLAFDYVHPMSVPTIRPPIGRIPQNNPIHVSGDLIVRFGMLEGTAVVDAKTCVFDPQAALAPEDFHANGSKAQRLAIVANSNEIVLLTGQSDMAIGARTLRERSGAEVLVAKCGLNGALVVTAEGVASVPAFRAETSFTIGSGDVFTSTFAAFWAGEAADPTSAARLASLAVAEYVEDRNLPSRPSKLLSVSERPVLIPRRGHIYLAGPFFTMGQRWLIDEARRGLSELGLKVFSPFHDVGPGPAEVVGPADVAAIHECDSMFAIIDGLDPGTIFEIGYARALGKRVICFNQTVVEVDLKMIVGSNCEVVGDFVTAIIAAATKR